MYVLFFIIMSKLHACTCTCIIQSDFNIQPLVSTCMSHSNFMQVFTWHKDYYVMLMS